MCAGCVDFVRSMLHVATFLSTHSWTCLTSSVVRAHRASGQAATCTMRTQREGQIRRRHCAKICSNLFLRHRACLSGYALISFLFLEFTGAQAKLNLANHPEFKNKTKD